jgi:toxin-antitoxin system PIN domain toxin
MKIDLPDVNVLFALLNKDHEAESAAVAWFDAVDHYALTPVTTAGLVRLLINPAAMALPVTPSQALQAIDALARRPGSLLWTDDRPVDSSMSFAYALTGHRQVADLHLLDLAASRGGRLVTFDRKIVAALRPRDRQYVLTLGVPTRS